MDFLLVLFVILILLALVGAVTLDGVVTLLFWGLIIALVVVLIRRLS